MLLEKLYSRKANMLYNKHKQKGIIGVKQERLNSVASSARIGHKYRIGDNLWFLFGT